MKKPATRITVADDELELEAKTADAILRPPVQVDIEDYTAGGTIELQDLGLANPPEPPMPVAAEVTAVPDHKHPEIYPFPAHNLTRYESRIRIVEAWQYQGALADAPPFVEKTWAAWGDHDQLRGVPAGPALRVPMVEGRETEKLCRKGDYVVRQEVTLALGVEPDMRIEVWPKEEFEKFFLPTSAPATIAPTPKEEPADASA